VTRGLEQFDQLVGEWVTGSKKYSEGRGRTTVAPAEGGKFLRIDSREEDDRFPQSTMLVGSDESGDECSVLYYDSRGVHRVYRMTIDADTWKMWREAPGFNQRFVGKLTDGGKTIAGQWEFSEDGTNWKVDFDLTYTKARS
jgi:hypothetical protein